MNLQDVRKGLAELREGLKSTRAELSEHFADVDAMSPEDQYGRKMWRFTAEATERLEDLVDDVNLADATFGEVLKYYGEGDTSMSSAEFYGIFKTFVISYRVSCIAPFCIFCVHTLLRRNANPTIKRQQKSVLPLRNASNSMRKCEQIERLPT